MMLPTSCVRGRFPRTGFPHSECSARRSCWLAAQEQTSTSSSQAEPPLAVVWVLPGRSQQQQPLRSPLFVSCNTLTLMMMVVMNLL